MARTWKNRAQRAWVSWSRETGTVFADIAARVEVVIERWQAAEAAEAA